MNNTMKQSQKIKGYWWMPEYPDEKIFGSIDYIPNSPIILELIGLWKGAQHTIADINFHKPLNTIYGQTPDGSNITLFNGKFENYYDLPIQGENVSYQFDSLLIGGLIPNDDYACINSISIRVEYMKEWGDISGINLTLKQGYPLEIYINFKELEERLLFESAGYTFKLYPSYQFGFQTKTVDEKVYLRIDFYKSINFKESLEFAQQIKFLFAFSISEVLGFEYLGIKLENTNYYSSILLASNPAGSLHQCNPEDMILPRKFIENNYKAFFERWLLFYKKCELMLGYYFDTQYYYKEFRDVNKFINLASALELYGRNCISNYTNFQNNIKTIIKIFEPLTTYLLDSDSFSQEISNTRNHLMHHNNSKGQNHILETNSLKRPIQQMIILVQMCIAKEMGMTPTQIVIRVGQASNLACYNRMHEFCIFRKKLEIENKDDIYQ